MFNPVNKIKASLPFGSSSTTHTNTEERDLRHEAHIRGIAVTVALSGLLGLLYVLGMWHVSGDPVATVVGVGVCLGLLFAGRGLWRFNRLARALVGTITGIALIGSIVVAYGAALGLVSLEAAVGLVWNLAVLWVLFGRRGEALFNARYRARVARTDHLRVQYTLSPFFLLPVALWIVVLLLTTRTGAFGTLVGLVRESIL